MQGMLGYPALGWNLFERRMSTVVVLSHRTLQLFDPTVLAFFCPNAF